MVDCTDYLQLAIVLILHTEAYVANGQYICEESMSIDYGALGANCLEDWVWVIISNFNVPTIPGTNFTQCT